MKVFGVTDMITQGKWKIANVDHREINANGIGICEIYYGESVFVPDKEEAIDNARLIAAAPDLLAAYKDVLDLIEIARQYFPKSIKNNDKFKLENTCATIRKAIDKAQNK